MSYLSKGVTPPTIDIHFHGKETQGSILVKDGDETVRLHALQTDDILAGKFKVNINDPVGFDHQGIKVLLVGTIDSLNDKSINTDFLVIQKEMEPPGTLKESKEYEFKFKFDKQHETYYGKLVKLLYFVRVIIQNGYRQKIERQQFFAVVLPKPKLLKHPYCPVKLELGFEERLHLEVSLRSGDVHLEDTLLGYVTFLHVNSPIKSMEVSIFRQETVYTQQINRENEQIIKFEIMDGCPQQGDNMPFRINLRHLNHISPTMNYIGGKFSVKYFLCWQLIDKQNERYQKMHEFNIFRAK